MKIELWIKAIKMIIREGEKKMMKAGIYARVSTQKEAQQDSIAHQEEKGKMVAQELGATIENVYIDDRKSGTKVARRKGGIRRFLFCLNTGGGRTSVWPCLWRYSIKRRMTSVRV